MTNHLRSAEDRKGSLFGWSFNLIVVSGGFPLLCFYFFCSGYGMQIHVVWESDTPWPLLMGAV